MERVHRDLHRRIAGRFELYVTLVIVGVGVGFLITASRQENISLANGTLAPFLSAAATVDGPETGLEAFRGEVILLDFWATYCATCEVTVPGLTRLDAEFGSQGLRVVGVSIDSPTDTARARRLIGELGGSYQVLFDRGRRLQDAYKLTLLPQTFLISRTGRIVWQQAGTIGGAAFPVGLETPKGKALIERLLAER